MVGDAKVESPPRSMQESMARLQEVNEAEWTNIQNFLKKSLKQPGRKAVEKKQGRWTGIHDRARVNDSEGLHDVIGGRRALPIQEPDTITESGWTSLHVAAMCNSAAAAAAAIEGKADINIKDCHGKSALHAAAANNAVEAMTHIVAAAKRDNVSWMVDDEGNTALHAAAASGSLEACRYLLNAGADPHARNNRGRSPQDVATTARFKFANELLVNGLDAFSKFQKLQYRPRTQRLLMASKPTIGTYPVRLRPNCEVCYRHCLDFVVGPVSCKPSPAWMDTLRVGAFASALKYRSASDRVKLQQVVIVAQNLYPQLAAMGLASSTPAFRRKVYQQEQEQERLREQPHVYDDDDGISLASHAAPPQLPAIGRDSAGSRSGSAAASPLGNAHHGRGGSRPGTRMTGRSDNLAAPRARMEVNEGVRKMASLVWSKSWSDPKSGSDVPALEVNLSDAEVEWRARLRETVDELSRLEPNWCRETERVWAVGQNRLSGGRFELCPPSWRLLLDARGRAAVEAAEAAEEKTPAKDVQRREYDVDTTSVWADLSLRQLEELYRTLGFHAIDIQEYLEHVPYPTDLHTIRRRAAAGYYRCYEQVQCDFLDMCMNWLAFDWAVRSDTQETYRAALSMAEQGLQLLMHRQEALNPLEELVKAEDEEAVRDSILLQELRDVALTLRASAGPGTGVRARGVRGGGARLEAHGWHERRKLADPDPPTCWPLCREEVLGRCPALVDQIMQLGEGWSVDSQEVDNLELFAGRIGDEAYALNTEGERVMLIPSKLELLRANRLVKMLRYIATGQEKFLRDEKEEAATDDLPTLSEEAAADPAGGEQEVRSAAAAARQETVIAVTAATAGGDLEGDREATQSVERGGLASRSGMRSRGSVRSRTESVRSGSSAQSEASALRGADGRHLALFKCLMPDGRRKKEWWRSLRALAVGLSSVDVKRLFQSDKEFDRYGRVRKRVIKFHPFEQPVVVSDGDERRLEDDAVANGMGPEILAPAGGRMLSSDMEKIHKRVEEQEYDVVEKMRLDLYRIVLYTLLSQLAEREKMKKIVDPRGLLFGGAEPTLLAPVMPSRVWNGELGLFGIGTKAVAWQAVHWHQSNHLGGWTHLDRKKEESRHSKGRQTGRRLSFPQIDYQIHVQPLPFTLPLHGSPCQCSDHYSYTILSTGTDAVNESDRASSASAGPLADGQGSSACLVRAASAAGVQDKGAKTCVLRGLQCAHHYEVKVRAVVVKPGALEEEGGMMKSSWSKSIFLRTPPAPPSAPQRLRPKHITKTSVVLTWGAPALLFGCPLSDCELSYRIRRIGHVVMRKKKGGATRGAEEVVSALKELQQGDRSVWEGGWQRAGFWVCNLAIEPLPPATEVEVVVRARNSAGWGDRSAAMVCSTLPERPLHPRAVEIRVAQNGGLEVRWREPALSNSRQRVLRYLVKVKEEDRAAAEKQTMSKDVAWVPAAREWTEAVQAVEGGDDEDHRSRRGGAADEEDDRAVVEREGEQEEEEAEQQTAYEFEQERMEMCFSADERARARLAGAGQDERGRGQALAGKHGEPQGAGERVWAAWDDGKTLVAMRQGWVSKRIAGLGPAKTISVAVQAVNEVGVSAWVHATPVVTPSERPAAPRDVRLDGFSHKCLILRWDRGDEGGSEVVLYRVRYATEGKVVSKFVNGGVLGVTLVGFRPQQQVEEVSVTALNALGASTPSHPLLTCCTLAAPLSVH